MFALLLTPLVNTFAAACDKPTFLGVFQPWYQYLNLTLDSQGNCSITNFTNDSRSVLGAHSPFLLIALAILDDLVRLAALIAVGYVIFGGIQYITSQGAPDMTKKAQQTIINALVGLAIAILAASIVTYLGKSLG
jgi:hypothetical protein